MRGQAVSLTAGGMAHHVSLADPLATLSYLTGEMRSCRIGTQRLSHLEAQVTPPAMRSSNPTPTETAGRLTAWEGSSD
jgi:hypothetical protein